MIWIIFKSFEKLREYLCFDRYTSEDVERQWVQHNQDGKDAIGWEEYRQLLYGFLDDNTDDNEVSEEDNEQYRCVKYLEKKFLNLYWY